MTREKLKEVGWLILWLILGSYGAGSLSIAFSTEETISTWALMVSLIMVVAFYVVYFTKVAPARWKKGISEGGLSDQAEGFHRSQRERVQRLPA